LVPDEKGKSIVRASRNGCDDEDERKKAQSAQIARQEYVVPLAVTPN
jgi:hypothetical protein